MADILIRNVPVEDLAAIAREVGGDRITVESIARGYQDPHFVEAKPSFILKLQKADVLVTIGRELSCLGQCTDCCGDPVAEVVEHVFEQHAD